VAATNAKILRVRETMEVLPIHRRASGALGSEPVMS
jgi:hypothetical protein